MSLYKNNEDRIDSLITADQNQEMFNNIAPYYDGANRILSIGLDRLWRRTAVKILDPKENHVYLDVGCGTGDICIEILRQNLTARVIGIDPSLGMLRIGWKKIRQCGMDSHISLRQGNCLDLDFPENSFDGAITVFCIRNVTDRKKAFSEIVRVLKPGSMLVVMELTEPVGLIMKTLFRIYATTVMPTITTIMSSVSAYKYLTDSMAAFPKPENLKQIMADSGLTKVTYSHMTFGIVTVYVGSKNTNTKTC